MPSGIISARFWAKRLFLREGFMADKIDISLYEKARIVVYGDIMLDRYWYGQASRISPEAPIPVVNVDQIEARPGGAANVALNVVALGASVELMGVVGDDQESRELETLLNKKSINCHFHRLNDHPTVTKLRVLGQNQQLLRLDFEKTLKHYEDKGLLQRYQHSLSHAQAVILSDYAKGALFNVTALIQRAREKGLPVLVDPKSVDFSRYAGATLLTPNLKEFEAVVGHCRTDQELESKARALIHQYRFEAILITRGKQGMMLIQKEGAAINLVAHAREVYDVTGAGDTVIAVMAASLAAGGDFYEAAQLANLAAGLVVRKLGAATVTVPELRRALHQITASHHGILSEKALLLAVADARAHGETIVMTNGCFDILHAGHVHYLEAAKAMGHRLIVAVNDDNSVRRLKGKDRPINSLQARMEVLTALRAIDWVVPFSEDTPARLITEVLPNILVKGGDYQPSQIAGGDEVVKNGGKVLTIPIKEGFSTSRLVEKMLN
ncbi:bifunctional D-glycero-beta-D-manno-heptose-7-phosphate kinase/D-glycero-beta-D-manno-heptose 1-phosphate adenylyltransferase HldE [Coxiella burnetii]|nr:bifunctional D-glycero-beta-D-manno-heptose-7-phosphate kinase/D-glycero-beta-D-manno-heptose 1-phosphate adenylyltransferase HldE [Coxiella burnetii]ABS76500.2 D-glycero-D-manno-heptose-7-phosphate 1-kinase [Coxiella burnetii Dugway 5J108-111]ACJ19654.1 D-glycero-D-manno-heptose-7-phosphate 1-kinase [Coxiella burnetii CbuK_Q154]OYK80912.1 bifunctional heptose 7-phosphate kinase/heptose 1-phosphate adenyltransferase [Coxiella burnetii]OYK83000.1 bifunctional heptose 7-phosphate kinase/heptos